MKRGAILVFTFILLAALCGGLGYFQFVFKPNMIKGFISQAQSPLTTVAAVEAKAETWVPRLPAIGSLRAVQGIDVAPQIGGAIVAVKVTSGQDVEKGDPLFDIDTSVEQADLKNFLATLKNAELALERQRALRLSGNTALSAFDAAQAARDNAAASAEKVRATIAQKTLVAPFSGRVGIRKTDLGQYVSPGMGLISLQQLDPIYVDFPAPEAWLAQLKPGQTIEIEVDAYPGRTFRGAVKTLDARVAQDSRNVLVQGELENKNKELLPGMFARVAVIAGAPAEVVTLPRTAITFSLYGDSVFVVKPAAPESGGAQAATLSSDVPLTIERRFVRVGDTREDRVAIVDGVKPGEKVVAEGQVKLLPGAKVRIDPDANLERPSVRPKE